VSSFDRSLVSSRRFGFVIVLLGLAGCQPLDSEAAFGEPYIADAKSSELEGVGVELPDGGVASNGCAATRAEAHAILERACAHCHGGDNPGARQGTPPFDCVLDTTQLTTMVSATAKDPVTHEAARFLVPGDPERSRIYLRPLNGEMPPPDVIGLPANPRPSVSDLSVLRHWIESCVDESEDEADARGTHQPDPHTATHSAAQP
jgi:hypothetical protein